MSRDTYLYDEETDKFDEVFTGY